MSFAVELATSQATGETSLGVLICCRSVRANKAATIKQGHSVPWSNPWCDWAAAVALRAMAGQGSQQRS